MGEIGIHVEEYGAGEPLVLLMGLGGEGGLWQPHIEVYQKYFCCITLNNRGVGRSSKSAEPYTIPMLAADTLAVMDKLELSKVHVSGISMGGAIAQQLAIMAPERVKTLTLTSTWDKSDLFTVRMFQTLKSVYETVDPHTFNRLLQMLIYVSEYINDHGNELESKETENGIDNNRMPVEAFHAQCDACISHDTRDLLQQINMPVLITAGENDVMIPLHFPNKLASKISNSRLEIFKRGGHAFHWEQLEKFNRVTLKFL